MVFTPVHATDRHSQIRFGHQLADEQQFHRQENAPSPHEGSRTRPEFFRSDSVRLTMKGGVKTCPSVLTFIQITPCNSLRLVKPFCKNGLKNSVLQLVCSDQLLFQLTTCHSVAAICGIDKMNLLTDIELNEASQHRAIRDMHTPENQALLAKLFQFLL